MRIEKDLKNDLLKRREVEAEAVYESNPGFERVLGDVAEHFEVDKELVVINRMGSSFGVNKFIIKAFIYDSVKDKDKIEPKKKEKKGKSK